MLGIDLFCGAGGMSLGARYAGIEVALAIEKDIHAANTYRRNHPACKLFVGDIRGFPNDAIQDLPRGNEGTVVFGGPPCRGFSYSNTQTRCISNSDNWLFEEYLRFVRIYEPDFVVFENVRGIIDTAGGMFLKRVRERISQAGYDVDCRVLNAKNHGIPQDRARLFLLGSRSSLNVRIAPHQSKVTPTVNDAISDLPYLENGASVSWLPYGSNASSNYAKRLRGNDIRCPNNLVTRNADYVIERYSHIPPGGNWQDIPPALMGNYRDRSRCHTGIYRRLDADRPSVVIANYRKNMLVHPTQNRGLSVREAARIQSFPDNYEFSGSIGFQQQQVGNAVPPLLAYEVFSALLQQTRV